MRPRLTVIILLLAALSGCGEPVRVSVPTSHPANPEAVSAPVPEPSTVLALPTAAPPVTASPTSTEMITSPEPPPPAQQAAAYACPMHPEETSDQPGMCPKCKMKLAPTATPGE